MAVVNAQGNMRIALPGVFVWVEGHPTPAATREKRYEPTVKLTGKGWSSHASTPASAVPLVASSRPRGHRRIHQATPFHLARDSRAHPQILSGLHTKAKIDHDVTGPAGAARLAPLSPPFLSLTYGLPRPWFLPTLWRSRAPRLLTKATTCCLSKRGRARLSSFTMTEKVSTVNPIQLYLNLHRDPRSGHEQADRLREEVMGF